MYLNQFMIIKAINQNTSDAIDIYQELNSELSKALAEAEGKKQL